MQLVTTETTPLAPSVVFNAVNVSSKKTGKDSRKRLSGLSEMSFVVHEGESVGILGSASDGVTVLKEVVAGVRVPTSGQVLVRSQPAVMDAGSSFDAEETLRSNMERIAMSLELNGSRLKSAIDRILKRVGMEDLADSACGELEPVEIERARLATHLHAGASHLLVEEPPAKGRALLDEVGRQGLERHLRLGGSLMLIAQDPQLLRKVCNRIIWIHQGSVIMDAPSIEVVRNFGRLESVRGDKVKTAQMYRRYARQYPGLRIITSPE